MMPKFIVTIDNLLPPHTVSLYILEPCLTTFVLYTVIISSQTKYGDTFSSIMGACRRISSKC